MALRFWNTSIVKLFFKKVFPYAGALGVISDVATPLASFADYLTITAVLICLGLSVYWFFFADRSDDWTMDKGFMPRTLVYASMSLVIFSFFSVSQAVTKTKKKGMIASIVPGVSQIQKAVFRLEETTKEMNAKLDRIEDQIDKKYTLSEIKILTDQEMWDEALTHIEDISPLKRGPKWRGVLGEIAEGWLYDQEIAEDWNLAHKETSKLFKRFKVLKKNKEAMAYRKKIGLRYLENCLRAQPLKDCHPASIAFIRYDRRSVEDLSFAVGKLTTYHRIAFAGLQYFDLAINEKSKDKYCDDKRVKVALANGWYGAPGSERVELAEKLSHLCFASMEARLRKDFDKSLKQKRKPSNSSKAICELFEKNNTTHKFCKQPE